MRIAAVLIVLLPAAFSPAITHGQDLQASKAAQPVLFAAMDRNGDNRISKTEAGAYKKILDRFAYIDTNGDGFITPDELSATLTATAAN